jgi:hypothetical protein
VRRLEASAVGRVLITVAMAVLVAALLVWNAPDGPAVRPAKPWASRIVLPVGIDQDWAVFAPQPRGFSVGIYAEVTRGDDSTVIWRPPATGLVIAPYRTYRWQKYVERIRGDNDSMFWEPAARAIARDVGGDVTKVVLWRTFADTIAPGDSVPRPLPQRFAFYTQDLP